jgi:hypothetical protein
MSAFSHEGAPPPAPAPALPCAFPGCNAHAPSRCTKCTEMGVALPSNLGRYCSREQQAEDFPRHKYLHSVIKRASLGKDRNNCSAPETILLGIMEATILGHRPTLKHGVLSILMVGARDTNEGELTFGGLLEGLQVHTLRMC